MLNVSVKGVGCELSGRSTGSWSVMLHLFLYLTLNHRPEPLDPHRSAESKQSEERHETSLIKKKKMFL